MRCVQYCYVIVSDIMAEDVLSAVIMYFKAFRSRTNFYE